MLPLGVLAWVLHFGVLDGYFLLGTSMDTSSEDVSMNVSSWGASVDTSFWSTSRDASSWES